MTRRDLVDFVLLAALWGASFLFMRIAAPEFGPFSLMLLRCAVGALVLIILLAVRGGLAGLRQSLVRSAPVGVVNSAIPFVLLGAAALSLTTGTLSILNATAPFWGAIVAWLWLHESLTRLQVLGLFLGFGGVVLLVLGGPGDPNVSTESLVVALGAALGATLAYGIAANAARRYLPAGNALANAAGSQIGATLVLLLPGILHWPAASPGTVAWFAALLLGTFSTGLAYILYFRLIGNIGPTRAITVTFAIPVFGTFFGWLFLGETVSGVMLVGALIVILGSSLTTQLLRSPHCEGASPTCRTR